MAIRARKAAPRSLGVGSDKFTFFIRNNGKNGSAWLQQLGDNARLVAAMQSGVSAVANGTSAKGTKTSDTYSLSGFGDALAKIHAVCQMMMNSPDIRTSLIGLDRAALRAALAAAGVPAKSLAMRVNQLWNWIYVHGARDFAHQTNLAKDFRVLLESNFTLARPEIVTAQVSQDGTRKWLLKTGAGIEFETVYIPERIAAPSASPPRWAAP